MEGASRYCISFYTFALWPTTWPGPRAKKIGAGAQGSRVLAVTTLHILQLQPSVT